MLWRNRIEPGSAFPAARRDREVVVAVLSGSGVLRERELALAFSAGDVLIIPAGALSQIVPDEDGQPFECVMAMPLATRHFTSSGDVMRLPWTD
jgi:quercetin dioxygenase-like cupin family protein